MNVTKNVIENRIPKKGELWYLDNTLILVVMTESNKFCYISLEECNRWFEPDSLENLYNLAMEKGYRLTKTADFFTISNG